MTSSAQADPVRRSAVQLSKGTTETSAALMALAGAQHEAAKPTAGVPLGFDGITWFKVR